VVSLDGADESLPAGALLVRPELYRERLDENRSVVEESKESPDDWRAWSGYTYGYNPPLLIRRVHDGMALLAALKALPERLELKNLVGEVELRAVGADVAVAGLAAMIAGPGEVQRLVLRPEGFSFVGLDSQWDAGFVPGSLKYGGLPAILGLCAPLPLQLIGAGEMPEVRAFYKACGAEAELVMTAK
jgi:hypothetical protein